MAGLTAKQPCAAARRILVLAPQPFYEDRGTPIAVAHLLRALVQLGFEVDLLTFPVGRSLELPGVTVLRAKNWFGIKHVPIGLSFAKILLDLSLTSLLRQQIRRQQYASIHAVEESAFLAAIFARKRGAEIVYDMQSSLPEQLTRYGIFRPRPIRHLLDLCESWLLRQVDAVACSVGLEPHVRAIRPELPIHEWNFPSLRSQPSASDPLSLREDLEIPSSAPVVLYTGTFEPYQGIDLLLEAIPVVLGQVPDCVVVLVGASDAAEVERAKRALAAGLRRRVRVLTRQPREWIPGYLEMADLLVSPRIQGANLPLKIFDYLAAGKPIVATAIETHRRVLDPQRAVLVPPDPQELAGEIIALLRDERRRRALAAAAEEYAEERLSWVGYLELVGEIHG
jgi:glycosyltransferase involved in cell wall biosynthesis